MDKDVKKFRVVECGRGWAWTNRNYVGKEFSENEVNERWVLPKYNWDGTLDHLNEITSSGFFKMFGDLTVKFELIEPTKKSLLKDGMKVVFRNGIEGWISNDYVFYNKEIIFQHFKIRTNGCPWNFEPPIEEKGDTLMFIEPHMFNDDLTHKAQSDFDIVKIFEETIHYDRLEEERQEEKAKREIEIKTRQDKIKALQSEIDRLKED